MIKDFKFYLLGITLILARPWLWQLQHKMFPFFQYDREIWQIITGILIGLVIMKSMIKWYIFVLICLFFIPISGLLHGFINSGCNFRVYFVEIENHITWSYFIYGNIRTFIIICIVMLLTFLIRVKKKKKIDTRLIDNDD